MLKKVTLFCFIGLLAGGCGGNGTDPSPDDSGKDRKVILTHWLDNIILPSYENFQAGLDQMEATGHAFANAPGETTLAAFRQDWVEAYVQWQSVELFEFGATDKHTLRNFFNIYPADEAGIAANIDNPSANLDVTAAYPRQGFPALDYLINGVAADDAAIVAYYTDPAEGQKRTDYLVRILDRMDQLLSTVIAEWSGAYRETFINETGLDIGSSMGVAVNGYVLHFERYIRSGKIGIPSGAAILSNGTPHPEKVEGFYYKDISLSLVKTATKAARDFFNGVDPATGVEGPSFSSYLDALGAKDNATGVMLSTLINDQFSAIQQKLDLLPENLYAQIQTNNQPVVDVHAEMQKLVRMLKVDMTSAMSITITYTDNDGD